MNLFINNLFIFTEDAKIICDLHYTRWSSLHNEY